MFFLFFSFSGSPTYLHHFHSGGLRPPGLSSSPTLTSTRSYNCRLHALSASSYLHHHQRISDHKVLEKLCRQFMNESASCAQIDIRQSVVPAVGVLILARLSVPYVCQRHACHIYYTEQVLTFLRSGRLASLPLSVRITSESD